VAGAGGIVAVASSISRVTSHGITGKRQRGKGERQRRIDFKWMGIRTGRSRFYRCSNLKFDLKAQGLSSTPWAIPSPRPSLFRLHDGLSYSDIHSGYAIGPHPLLSPPPPLRIQAWVG